MTWTFQIRMLHPIGVALLDVAQTLLDVADFRRRYQRVRGRE
jgi:hypothetical protein